MTLPLTLVQTQNNCETIMNYSFSNMVGTENRDMYGYSYWNVFKKAIDIGYRTVQGNEVYLKSVEKVALLTLEGIKAQFPPHPSPCPLFFYVDTLTSNPNNLVSYSEVANRFKNSKTFKDNVPIQNAADEILKLYKISPFGLNISVLSYEDVVSIKQELLLRIASKHFNYPGDRERAIKETQCLIQETVTEIGREFNQDNLFNSVTHTPIEIKGAQLFWK